jgi:glutamate-1-semialdehyde 2,1-aminomutase
MPQEGFLRSLRELTEENDIVLIFDEIVTAFRHDLGGAQRIFGVTPDLTCLGKPMANGFPIAAVCGREDIMNHLAPVGNVHMSGTYYGYPVSVAAAYATIEQLENGSVHKHIEKLGDHIRKGLSEIISHLQLKAQVVGFKSIFWVYFTDANIVNYESLLSNDNEMFQKFAAGMRQKGIFFLPRPFKRCHISAAHSMSDAEKFLTSAKEVLSKLT